MRMSIAKFKKSRAELTFVKGTGDSNTIKRDEKKDNNVVQHICFHFLNFILDNSKVKGLTFLPTNKVPISHK